MCYPAGAIPDAFCAAREVGAILGPQGIMQVKD